jgi:quercetin dioxygenase-like cupin family protein
MGGRLRPLGAMSAFPLPAGGTLRVVNPEDHGLGAIVVTTSEHPPGEAVPSHMHPCGEIFVVTGGRGRFTVEEDTIVADVGDMVLVPPETWHGFEADGDEAFSWCQPSMVLLWTRRSPKARRSRH